MNIKFGMKISDTKILKLMIGSSYLMKSNKQMRKKIKLFILDKKDNLIFIATLLMSQVIIYEFQKKSFTQLVCCNAVFNLRLVFINILHMSSSVFQGTPRKDTYKTKGLQSDGSMSGFMSKRIVKTWIEKAQLEPSNQAK